MLFEISLFKMKTFLSASGLVWNRNTIAVTVKFFQTFEKVAVIFVASGYFSRPNTLGKEERLDPFKWWVSTRSNFSRMTSNFVYCLYLYVPKLSDYVTKTSQQHTFSSDLTNFIQTKITWNGCCIVSTRIPPKLLEENTPRRALRIFLISHKTTRPISRLKEAGHCYTFYSSFYGISVQWIVVRLLVPV